MFDIHSHSTCSDGTNTPSEVVDIAKEKGLDLFSLTDHDSIAGVAEATLRAKSVGLRLISGCEMEAEFYDKLHLLCLGMDINEPCFQKMIHAQREFRLERNHNLDKKLRSLSLDVSNYLNTDSDSVTRAHYAKAMVDAGYVSDLNEAYDRYLARDALAYVHQRRFPPRQVIDATVSAGGICVLAHPMQMHCEPAPMVRRLVDDGIWGIEAYYYNATPGETVLFSSLAHTYNLFVTCGSDYHGINRPEAVIGKCYRNTDDLIRTEEELRLRFFE